MRTYRANDELQKILYQHGFKEVTSLKDKKKGKRAFKPFGKGKKEIYFDYENIIIFDRFTAQDSRYTITEKEFRLLLMYFKLNRTDYKLIQPEGLFKYKEVETRLDEIKREYKLLLRRNIRIRRQYKLIRILNTFENIMQVHHKI